MMLLNWDSTEVGDVNPRIEMHAICSRCNLYTSFILIRGENWCKLIFDRVCFGSNKQH